MEGEKGSIFQQLVFNHHQGDQGGGGETVRDHSTNSSVSVKQSREEKIKSERNFRWVDGLTISLNLTISVNLTISLKVQEQKWRWRSFYLTKNRTLPLLRKRCPHHVHLFRSEKILQSSLTSSKRAWSSSRLFARWFEIMMTMMMMTMIEGVGNSWKK